MRPFSRWTRPQRRGLLIVFALSFFGHISVFKFAKKSVQQHMRTPLPDAVVAQRDSLLALKPPKDTLYPFNPNYMSAYHAYRLGLPKWIPDSIQKRVGRRQYFSSQNEVRRFLRLSDSSWLTIAPYIKLPEFASVKRKTNTPKFKLQLNSASLEQLQQVYGIGPVLAERILDMRTALGGFLNQSQLEDVWGLQQETMVRLWRVFSLDSVPVVNPININNATINELAGNYYISYGLAARMVAYRSRHGQIDDLYQMAQSLEIDSVRIARIALYLNTKKLLE